MTSPLFYIYYVTEEHKDDRYFILVNKDHEYGNNHKTCLSIFEDLVEFSNGQLKYTVLDFDSVSPTVSDKLESFIKLKLYITERYLGIK